MCNEAKDFIGVAEPYLNQTGGVISALRAIQDQFGCVPESADKDVAEVFNISRAEVRGIVSFYADLTREPKAGALIRVCAAEACQAAGGRALRRDLEALVDGSEFAVGAPDEVAVEAATLEAGRC